MRQGTVTYVYIMYETKKGLNGTLVLDSPFQTLTVNFSLKS